MGEYPSDHREDVDSCGVQAGTTNGVPQHQCRTEWCPGHTGLQGGHPSYWSVGAGDQAGSLW